MADNILVVIPTLNEAAHIEACLRDLVAGDAAARESTVIVADGGSTDGTQAIVERLADDYPNVRILHNPKRIQSAGVNLAARTVGLECDVLIRCDAHSVYPANYVSKLIEAMARSGADSVVTPMDARGEGCFQRALAWIVDTPLGSGGAPHRGGTKSGYVDHGHHAAFKMARFLALGGYDETFSHNEDAEYDRRLALAGGRVWLDADIRLGYFPRSTPAALWRQYWNYGKGRARMLAKHRLKPAPRQLIPVINLALIAASLAAVPFAGLPALAWPALYLAVLASASLICTAAIRSVCGVFAGAALAVMHLSWALGYISMLGKSAPAYPARETAAKGEVA